jgi:BirA family biotin operon repressor/biotin-[acetyl-CoA-carboxylase] ligase
MDTEALKTALADTSVSAWRAFDEIGSTNDEALRWIDEGAPDMALVIAERQTSGRGRFTRHWVTEPGVALAFTAILRPTKEEEKTVTSLYAPMAGLAVWQALREELGLSAQIKWPNDVLLERCKCCGILSEAVWTGSRLNGIVLGIGINVKAGSLPPESNALFPATYLEEHTAVPVNRWALLAAVVRNLTYWRGQLGSAEFLATWQSNLAFKGEQVRVEQAGEALLSGELTGVDCRGNLLLRDASGATIIAEVGDVHLRSGS